MLKRGKIPTEKTITEIRELSREDLDLLRDKRQLPVISRLRDPHHLLARLLAAGMRTNAAAIRAGYSINRASQLQQDPAFAELVESYRSIVTAEYVEQVDEFIELATGNMLKAERQLAERLEEAEEEGTTLPVKDLVAIRSDSADRLGYGKKQTNLNVNVDFAAKLERAISRSSKVINAQPNGSGDSEHSHTSQPQGAALPMKRRA